MDDGIVSLTMFTDENPYIDVSFIPILAKRVEELKDDKSVRAIVVEGGNRYFCAGASREALLATDPEDALLPKIAEIPRLLLSLPVPTIAAMAGHAIGGGFLIGLWCDIAVLADESLYGINAMALGITPVMGSSVILEEVLGAPLSRELLFTGRMVKGLEIKEWNVPLTHTIVPYAGVRDFAFSIAQDIADKPRKPMALYKQALSSKRRKVLELALAAEESMYEQLQSDVDINALIAERYPVAYSQSSNGSQR